MMLFYSQAKLERLNEIVWPEIQNLAMEQAAEAYKSGGCGLHRGNSTH